MEEFYKTFSVTILVLFLLSFLVKPSGLRKRFMPDNYKQAAPFTLQKEYPNTHHIKPEKTEDKVTYKVILA